MEGTQCSQSGCNCHDFLPFECALCGDVYCLEHRSRFNHSCVIYEPEDDNVDASSSNGNQASVKSMFESVTNRFMGTDQPSSSTEHHRVKSTSVPKAHQTDAKLARKLNKLDNVSSNDRQRSISNKTRQMLVKNKALGSSEVAGADRHYLEVYFIYQPTSAAEHMAYKQQTEPSYFYFNKNASIAEMIASIKKNYSNLVNSHYPNLPPGLTREMLTLAVITEDSPNWKLWNRNATLKDTFLNFEPISLFPMEINEVVSNQAKLQSTPRVITLSNPIPKVPSEEELALKMRVIQKGDIMWYHKVSNKPPPLPTAEEIEEQKKNNTSANMGAIDPMDIPFDQEIPVPVPVAAPAWEQDEMLLVKVVAVHHDDYPNIYYTIAPVRPIQFINGANNNTVLNMRIFDEKQTDAAHLNFLRPGDASGADKLIDDQTRATLEALGDPVPIRISYGDAQYQNVKIGNMCTIAQLRQLVRIVTGAPEHNMKLICKGSVLKTDTQLIKNSKIVNGSKIIVMTSSGAK